jgi:predicted methyltransferase
MRMLSARVIPLAGLIGFSLMAAVAVGQSRQAAFESAMASPDRPAEDKARDAIRRPYEVIGFVGIEPGMTVLDAFAGGGWYTEVLSAAVGPSGKVYMHNAPGFVSRRGPEFTDALRARAERLGNVELLLRDLNDLGIDGQADAAITALNLHDAYAGGRQAALDFLGGIYAALRPGGVLGFIDHVGAPGVDNSELHRIDRETVRALLAEVGFVVEAESDLLANPEDDHSLGVRDAALGRKTDRMLFRVRKPAAL